MDRQNPNYKIGLYKRNSDVKQDTEEGTLKNQEFRLREYVKLRSISGNFGKIVETYEDRSLSAKDMNRPELQRLLRDVEKGKVNLILVTELSRVTRNMRDFVEVWQFLKEKKCGFLSLRENVDTSNAAGEMVMFTLANVAQFEREQTRERVTANLKARAKRGLYNGGTVPLGYKTIQGKPGYLEIDKERAAVVKKAFETYLKLESLQATAKSLNDQNIKIDRIMQGGGNWPRLDFFTVDNLHFILKNKAYKGIRDYKDGEGRGESKAVWAPIINPHIFDQIQDILEKNNKKKKPFTKKRWPYTLSGLTYCLTCGDVMCGKSAHGRSRKYGYYEHSWASKKGSIFTKKIFKCDPHRVSAEKLEKIINEKIFSLLSRPKLAQEIIQKAHKIHKGNSVQKEIMRYKKKIAGYESNLDALADRLSSLPKSVSATPIFRQMGKLESAQREVEKALLELEMNKQNTREVPVDLKDYKSFLGLIKKSFEREDTAESRSRLLKRLIHKIEVGTDKILIHFFAGFDTVECQISQENFFQKSGSRTLTSGAQERT